LLIFALTLGLSGCRVTELHIDNKKPGEETLIPTPNNLSSSKGTIGGQSDLSPPLMSPDIGTQQMGNLQSDEGITKWEIETNFIMKSQELEMPKIETNLSGGEILDKIFGSAYALAFDKDNILWMSILRGIDGFDGIIAYNNKKFHVFDLYNTRIPHASVNNIFVDNQNIKWFGNKRGEVFTFDNKQWKILPVPEKIILIDSIKQDYEGKIWCSGRTAHDTCLWSYRDDKIDKIYFGESVEPEHLTTFAIDTNNNIWVGDSEGIWRFDGTTWENLENHLLAGNAHAMVYDDKRQILYIATVQGYSHRANISAYQDGQFTALASEKTGLPSVEPSCIQVDKSGDLWIGYNISDQNDIAAIRYDGEKWLAFSKSSPLSGGVKDITIDSSGRIWFEIERPEPWTAGLTMFDGNTWYTDSFPMFMKDPRIWWRQKTLSELFNLPIIDIDINQVLANPIDYRGKKIRIIGRIESGFEYASLVELNGNNLHMWPDYQNELGKLFTETGIGTEIKNSDYQEYIGYLEFEGGYGHLSAWSYQLMITEVYPYPISDQKKASFRKLYKDYLHQ
jgi:hypothetical protein